MNLEHSRGRSRLDDIPDNALYEFDAETAGLVPLLGRSRNNGDLLLYREDVASMAVLAPSCGGEPIRVRESPGSTLFARRDTDDALIPREPGRVAPKVAAALVMAAVVAAVLVTSDRSWLTSAGWRGSAPQLIEAQPRVDVAKLALGSPPLLQGSVNDSEDIVPPVYGNRYTAGVPVQPVAATVEVSSAIDIETIRRALDNLRSQNPSFDHCDVRMMPANRAVARCKGRLGDLSVWTMSLGRAGEQWELVSDEAPPN
jgi:hypothetical protein